MIEYSDNFSHEAKKLSKKYKLIKQDIKSAIKEINKGNHGTPLGLNLFKKRVKNSSIPTGKRGGFRVIIYQKLEDRMVLLYIYAKPQKETLSDEELKNLLSEYNKVRVSFCYNKEEEGRVKGNKIKNFR